MQAGPFAGGAATGEGLRQGPVIRRPAAHGDEHQDEQGGTGALSRRHDGRKHQGTTKRKTKAHAQLTNLSGIVAAPDKPIGQETERSGSRRHGHIANGGDVAQMHAGIVALLFEIGRQPIQHEIPGIISAEQTNGSAPEWP